MASMVRTVRQMQELAEELRRKGSRIGLVPTMGALHQGHLSLVDIAKKNSDRVVVSIYVNPTQFGRGEDFGKYPRTLESDTRLASERGVDFIFAPSDTEMYPEEHLAFVEVDKVSRILEGEFRPTHFKGVTTVVAKLFNVVKPHLAVFGQKDAQQAFIIKKMVRDLNFDVEIMVAPIVREKDWLAMSSRNVYLSSSERENATVLYKSLKHAERSMASGRRHLNELRTEMVRMIAEGAGGKIDYISFVDPASFETVDEIGSLSEVLAVLAVRFGQTRLIDNMLLKVK